MGALALLVRLLSPGVLFIWPGALPVICILRIVICLVYVTYPDEED